MNTPHQPKIMKIAPTMNLTLKPEVVSEVGWFDETLIHCEDTDLTYKISQEHEILYEPNAVI
jgi:GT2 family glycosyltransferase